VERESLDYWFRRDSVGGGMIGLYGCNPCSKFGTKGFQSLRGLDRSWEGQRSL